MRPEYKRSKVGFPIRKSLDQSSFAAPQGLSQRTTSFIASQRQGIHRMLLRHLITLVIDVRIGVAPDTHGHKKTSDEVLSNPITVAYRTWPSWSSFHCQTRPHSLFTMSIIFAHAPGP